MKKIIKMQQRFIIWSNEVEQSQIAITERENLICFLVALNWFFGCFI